MLLKMIAKTLLPYNDCASRYYFGISKLIKDSKSVEKTQSLSSSKAKTFYEIKFSFKY